jgi:hypothetical protein
VDRSREGPPSDRARRRRGVGTLAIGLAAVVASSASVAYAAGIGISTRKVGGGNTAVVACDTNGFTVTFTTTRGNLTAITVGGIADPACEGGTLRVTVTDTSGASIAAGGPQTVPTDGDTSDNSLTVSTSPQPAASQVAGYNVSIVGP